MRMNRLLPICTDSGCLISQFLNQPSLLIWLCTHLQYSQNPFTLPNSCQTSDLFGYNHLIPRAATSYSSEAYLAKHQPSHGECSQFKCRNCLWSSPFHWSPTALAALRSTNTLGEAVSSRKPIALTARSTRKPVPNSKLIWYLYFTFSLKYFWMYHPKVTLAWILHQSYPQACRCSSSSSCNCNRAPLAASRPAL